MAQLDPLSRQKCSVCGQPFYDPEQGSVKDYRYTNRYVSDAHRVMFHSSSDRDQNYDPDYNAAFDRINQRQINNADRLYNEQVKGAARLAEIAHNALDLPTKEP